MTEECITQVSAKLEGVTKKISQEFSWTESRNLAFSLNLMIFSRTQKFRLVTQLFPEYPGATIQKTGNWLGIFPKTIPVPKWCFLPVTWKFETIQSRKNLNTWWQDYKRRFPTAPLGLRQENQRRRAPQVSHNLAVTTPLWQLKKTRFCWPSNNWWLTVFLPILTTTSIESRKCPNPSQRQCPHLTEKQKKIQIVGRSVLNKFDNPQSTHGIR